MVWSLGRRLQGLWFRGFSGLGCDSVPPRARARLRTPLPRVGVDFGFGVTALRIMTLDLGCSPSTNSVLIRDYSRRYYHPQFLRTVSTRGKQPKSSL